MRGVLRSGAEGAYNLYGGPAISVPCGLSEGLPVGLQIMGPTIADDRIYRVAAALESVIPALTPRKL
jgi:aspartyl-tRNA(Asn)/glutamyl-tRNA(Gln) amidotransferase subunit A